MIDAALKKKFFLSNWLLFLVPLTIPLVVLGGFSIILSENYIKDYLNKSNRNLLTQTNQNLRLVLNTLDPISLILDNDSGVSSFFETLFSVEGLEYPDVRTQNLINGFFTSQALSRPFIHSIYVYYPNPKGYFYATNQGRVSLSTHRDKAWIERWRSHQSDVLNWTELRLVPEFTDWPSRPLITIFHPLSDSQGVVLLNLEPLALQSIWSGLSIPPGQELLVLSQNGQVLLSNRAEHLLPEAELQRLATAPDPVAGGLIVSSVRDERYGWILLSLTPEEALYRVPAYLSSITVVLLVISFVAGFLLTNSLVRRQYGQAESIMSVIESAEQAKPLPPLPQRVGTIYEQITYDLLKTFFEQNYLKLQLSEKTARARLLELETRQNQMNPHFLFNTLKTIYWKSFALSGSPNEACAMIDNLSEILDYALRQSTEPVALEDEIRTTKSYLAIQEVRYAGRFSAQWRCSPRLGRCLVPKLLLQPLLENSLYHGIQEGPEPCRIRIQIKAAGADLHIAVSDTGAGMSPQTLEALRERLASPSGLESHIGLANTHRRLQLTYGEAWGLEVNSRPGRGTTVLVRIPLSSPGPDR